MPRHKHADVIIAWANGETVQQFNGEDENTTYWVEWNNTCGITPAFDYGKWRIKPKTVTKKAEVIIYKSNNGAYEAYVALGNVEVDMYNVKVVKRMQVEWEEEE